MEDWTEKYRPESLDEIVGNERAVTELKRWADTWNHGNPNKRAVILSGGPGTGKTSSALALAKDYGWPAIELNTSDARNATKIKKVATFGAVNETFDNNGNFVSSHKGGRKLIVLDEADNLYERISKDQGKDRHDRGASIEEKPGPVLHNLRHADTPGYHHVPQSPYFQCRQCF